MTAKQMFVELGWYIYVNNGNYIGYAKNENGNWKRIIFKLRKNKVTLHSDVNWELLKAIAKQFEELGWTGETE